MSKSRITLLICLLLSFSVGATVNSLATSLLAFQRVFGASNEVLGRIQFLFFIGGGLIVLAGGWLTDRLGDKKAAMAALSGLTIGSLLVAYAPNVTWVLASSLLFGLGSTWVYVAYSVIVARQFADRRLSMFSLISLSETTAAILQPMAFGAWFAHVQATAGKSWLSPYAVLAGLPFMTFLLLSFLWKPAPVGTEASREVEKKQQGSARVVLLSVGIWLIGFCNVLHGVFQIAFVSWIGPYHAARSGITPAQAALFIAFNAGGFVVGRALLGWLCTKIKIPDLVLLGLSAGAGTVFVCLALLSHNYALALGFTFVEGIFVAGDAPAMSSFVGGRFLSRVALAYALYVGLGQVGAAAGGYIVGFLGDWMGDIQRAAWVIPIVSGGLSLLALTWHFLGRLKPAEDPPYSGGLPNAI